jgi:regulator of protease activity HflC (stomatin/prohibitin superfamily)
LDLDHAFSSKNEIADNVKNSLADLMDDYGYRILNVLIVDLDPDSSVKNAMNEINGGYSSGPASLVDLLSNPS